MAAYISVEIWLEQMYNFVGTIMRYIVLFDKSGRKGMVRIPIANKHDNTATNQHLVPRCYMKEWSYNPKGTSV